MTDMKAGCGMVGMNWNITAGEEHLRTGATRLDAIGRMAGWVRIPMYLNFSAFEERP